MVRDEVWREPIRWINLQGEDESNPHAFRHPFVQVEVSAVEQGKKVQCLALVDTGATHSLLKPELIKILQAEKQGERKLTSNHAVQVHPTYPVWLVVLGCPILNIKVHASPVTLESENYTPHIVLGFDVLRYCRLVLDPIEPSFLEFRRSQIERLRETAPLTAAAIPHR